MSYAPSGPTDCWQQKPRAALMWMLREADVPVVEIAAAFGLSRKTVYQITRGYELRLNRRDDTASSWNEPWARRLRAAGAIR